MRVLLVNSFYYPRGGDCVHMLALEQSLLAAGHEVAVFAMTHPQNLPSPWQSYWPEYEEYGESLGVSAAAKAAIRTTYSKDVLQRLLRLLVEFRPHVAHLHSVHHHLTVSVVDALGRAAVPVVWTLHDYRVVCPATHLLRDDRPCTLCTGGRYWNCVVHGCKGASRTRSLSVAVESSITALRGVYRHRVAHFVAPSGFLARTVVAMGIPEDRITAIPNPLTAEEWTEKAGVERHGALYVGRLSREKGVGALLRAHAHAGQGELRIIGDGPDEEPLRLQAASLAAAVRFDGWLDKNAVREALNSTAVLCVPSQCYENCPTVVLEALAMRTLVMATDIGGLTELLDNGRCGVLLPPGDEQQWASALRAALDNRGAFTNEIAAGRRRVLERHDPVGYVQRLEAVYADAVSGPHGSRRGV